MELIFRICLFVSGVVNIIPSILFIFPQKFSESYGIEIPNADFELLLRHRAVLFGIIGGLMIYAAIAKRIYSIAVLIGFLSMSSFIILFMLIDEDINRKLNSVFQIDIIALVTLSIGYLLYRSSLKPKLD